MKDFLKWGLLLGGAGYFLFRDQISALATIATPPAAGTIPASTTPQATTTPPAATAPPVAQTTLQMMQAFAAAHGFSTLSFDQWNWVYDQVRGVPALPIETVFPGQARERLMTIDEWWAGSSAAGLSGVRRRSSASRAWGY